MSKAVPWSVKGVDFDVREAAHEAARREGMTISEWLSEAISVRAAQAGVAFDHLDEDERLAAIAQRLEEREDLQAGGYERHRRPARALPREGRDLHLADARRYEPVEDRHSEFGEGLSPLDAEALLERAVERFQRQSAKSQRQTSDALASMTRLMRANEAQREDTRAVLAHVSRRLGDLESNLSRRTPEEDADALKTALGRLEARLDAMARRSEPAARGSAPRMSAADAPADADTERLNRFEATLNTILAAVAPDKSQPPRQARTEMRASVSPRSLGEAIAQIAQRQHDLEAPPRPSAATALDRPASQADILALANKIDGISREVLARPPQPAFDLDKLHAEIAQMSTALHDLASRGSVAALETSIRRLTQEIEVSRREGANETVLRPLEQAVADLRRSLAEIDPRTTIAGLEGRIQALDSKLDDLGRPNIDADAVHEVQRQTREIRDLLTAAAARPTSVEKIEQQVAQLARNLDRQQQVAAVFEGGSASDAERSELRALLADTTRTAALEKIEARLGDVATRVDEVLRDARSTRQSPEAQGLEDLVRGLAEKIEAARSRDSDTRALEALQQQIGDLATRLDRSSTGLSSLPQLQQAIGDLFTKLEATQRITVEVAETAARNAAQESLREAIAQGAFDNLGPLGNIGLRDEVSREISELRDMHDATDRRTHSTLNAVHETLEKVVDRLALLEEELSDVRPEATPATLASGPAPNFAAGTRPPGGQARPDERTANAPRRENLDDLLIEPGRGFPGRGEPEPGAPGDKRRKTDRRSGTTDAPVTDRADFIAAARRAAQAAQMDSAAAAADARSAVASGDKEEARPSLVAQARRFIAEHKRPVVLSVAALFLIVGAYAVINAISQPPADLSSEPPKAQTQDHTQRTMPAAPANLLANAQPPATPAPAEPQKAQPVPANDPIVVGTIAQKKDPASAASETTHDMSQSALLIQADLGNAKAQFELASRYLEGRGLTRDTKAGAQWYEKAAAQGLAAAQYRLGSLYEKGLGVTRDLAVAKSWYLKSAEQGNVRAMHNLAVLMAEAGEGGQPDYVHAAQWFRKAAEYGVRDSQYNYAILLARGLGGAQNLTSSYTWFAIAAAQGDQDAGKKREDVAARLSADDLATAKAVAEGFHARTPEPTANDVQWPASAASQPQPQTPGKPQKPKVSQL